MPNELQGRVWAFTSTIGASGEPLGSGSAGVLLLGLGTPALVALSGVPLLVIGLIWLVVGPIRQVVDENQ